MIGKYFSLLLLLFGQSALSANTSPTIHGKIRVSSGVKIDAQETFVVWTEHCSQKKTGKNFLELVQKDFRYEPSSLVAVKGERLRVRNEDKAQHNSFALQRVGFDSGLQKPGTKYDVELTNPGLTKVFCRIHPKMVADVLVLPSPCYVEIHGEKEMASFSLPAPPKGNPGKAWLWSPNLKGFQRVSLKDGEPLEFFLDESMFLKKVEAATAGGDSYN